MINLRQINSKNCPARAKYLINSLNRSISQFKTLKYHFSDNIIHASFNNDVILSASGQAKIDCLESCLSLVKDDFIVY